LTHYNSFETSKKLLFKKRNFTLKNGLKATVSLLENTENFQFKKKLLSRLEKILGDELTQKLLVYIVTFHLNKPVYVACLGINLRPMMRNLKSESPEEALNFCAATMLNGEVRTQIFTKSEHVPTLKMAIKYNVAPEVATLLLEPSEEEKTP